jgi:GH25 family lysozyme M1 (1,4-beta-N-acetylmuramidase)
VTASAQGIDVSAYQAPLAAPDLAGLDFAFAKATEGSDVTDQNFAGNWQAIKSAGKFRGAYHELRPGFKDPATAQAAHFLATVAAAGLEPGDMLAVSASDYPVTDADARAFCDAVRAGTGGQNPVIVYTDLSVAATLVSCTGYPLWIAWPSPAAPASVAPWEAWTLWQWGETGLDRDAFNGTAAEMAAWIAAFGTPVPPADWTFGAPQNLTAQGGHTTVGLAWDPPAGAPEAPAEYQVYVYQGAVCNRSTLVPSYPRTVAASPFEGGSLEQGQPYTAHVVASGSGGARVRQYCYASAEFTTG